MIKNFKDFLNEENSNSITFELKPESSLNPSKIVSQDEFIEYFKKAFTMNGSYIFVKLFESCLNYVVNAAKKAKGPITISSKYGNWGYGIGDKSYRFYINGGDYNAHFMELDWRSFSINDVLKKGRIKYIYLSEFTFKNLDSYKYFDTSLNQPIRIYVDGMGGQNPKEIQEATKKSFLKCYERKINGTFLAFDSRIFKEPITWNDLPKIQKEFVALLKNSTLPLKLAGKGIEFLEKRKESSALKELQLNPTIDNFIAVLNSKRPTSKSIYRDQGHSYGAKSDSNSSIEYFDISKILATTSITPEWIWQHEKDILNQVKGQELSIITSRTPIKILDVTKKQLVIQVNLTHVYD